jgi:hypothetical protein
MRSYYIVPGLIIEGAPRGALPYIGDGGKVELLTIPPDWNAQNAANNGYALRIAAGIPAWRTSGLATVEGVVFAESEPSGSTGPVRDAGGNLVYGFPE